MDLEFYKFLLLKNNNTFRKRKRIMILYSEIREISLLKVLLSVSEHLFKKENISDSKQLVFLLPRRWRFWDKFQQRLVFSFKEIVILSRYVKRDMLLTFKENCFQTTIIGFSTLRNGMTTPKATQIQLYYPHFSLIWLEKVRFLWISNLCELSEK